MSYTIFKTNINYSLFLPKRRDNDEKNYQKKYNEEKNKLDFYRLFHEILESCQFNQYFYAVLLFIEFLQIQYYAWHPFLDDFLFKTEYRLKMRELMQYFQVYFIVYEGKSFEMVIIMYSFIGILLMSLGLAYFIYKEMQKTNRKLVNSSTLINWSLKILHIYMALMVTILPLPMFNIFIVFLQCNSTLYMKEFTCYQGTHLIHLPFSLIGLLLFGAQTIASHIYFNDSNPNSKFPLAQPETLNHFLKLGLKFALSYYFVIDPDGNLVALYNIFFMFFVAYVLNERFMSPAIYNRVQLLLHLVFCFLIDIVIEIFIKLIFQNKLHYLSINKITENLIFLFQIYCLNKRMNSIYLKIASQFNIKIQYLIQQKTFINKQFVFCVLIFLESITLFTLCINIVVKYIDPEANDIGFLYTFIGKFLKVKLFKIKLFKREEILLRQEYDSGPLLYTFFITGYDFYSLQISKKTIDQVTSDNDKQSYILQFFNLIKNRHNYNKAIMLEGMTRWHQINCEFETCFCKLLKVDELMSNDREFTEEEQNTIERKWYFFLESIIQQLIQKSNKPFKLHLLWAYILSDRLNNYYRSLIELMNTIHDKPGFQEVYSVYRHQSIIQQYLFEEFDKKSENSKELDFDKIVIYSDKIIIFQEEVDKSCILHMNYWRELMEQSPEIQKIEKIGQKITLINKKIKDIFEDITSIYSQNIKLLTLYGNYLKLILNETDESQRFIDNIESIKKQQSNSQAMFDMHKIKYGQNSKVGLVLCNSKHDVVGTIHKVNKEALAITKFKKHELIDQNVSKIMPKIYAELHDQFMVNYLVTSKPKVMEADRIVMVQNKCFQLIPCSIYLRTISSLEEGLLIAGFINEIQFKKPNSKSQKKSTNNSQYNSMGLQSSDHYILYRPDSDIVEGISKSLTNKLGITVDDIQHKMQSQQTLSMERILPDIYDPEGIENMSNGSGQVMEIDVIQILYYYLLDEENEDAVDDDSDKQDSDNDSYTSGVGSVDDSELSKITEEDKLLDNEHSHNEKSKRQSRGRSFSEKNSLKSKINKMQGIKVRVCLVQQHNFSGKKINLIKLTEEESDDMTDTKRFDYKKLAKTLVGGRTLTAKNNDSEKDDLQTKDSNLNETKDIEQHIKSKSSEDSDSDSKNLGSSHFQESNINEDQIRNIKDFKQRISEKNIPKSVIIMNRFAFMMLMFVLALLITEFVIKLQSNQVFERGTNSISNSYSRHHHMTDINYYSRKIWAIANDYWKPPSGQTALEFMKINQDTILIKYFILQLKQLAQHVNLLQKSQFQIIKDVLEVNKIKTDYFDNVYLSVDSMLQDGNVVPNQVEFTDSIFSYTTGASSLANSTIDNMKFPDGKIINPVFIGSSQKYFFFNKVNGIFSQRNVSEVLAEQMYEFYDELTYDYHHYSQIIFIISLVIIFIGLIAILPFIVKIHKANNKVLSLFGLISIKEIQELVVKIENFQNLFLDSKNEERVTSLSKLQTQKLSLQNMQTQAPPQKDKDLFEIRNETESERDMINPNENDEQFHESKQTVSNHDEENVQQNENNGLKENNQSGTEKTNQQNNDSRFNEQDKQYGVNQVSKFALQQMANKDTKSQKKDIQTTNEEGGEYDDKTSFQQKNLEKQSKKSRIGGKRVSERIKRDEKEILLERSQKINESTNSSSLADIYKIIFFSLIFFSLFITLYFTNETNLQNIRQTLNHYKLLQQRNPLIKYTTLFCFEELATGNQQIFDNKELREQYSDIIYEQEQEIFETISEQFPPSFDSYKSYFFDINNNDVCLNLITLNTDSNNKLTKEECQTVANRVLQKGIKLTTQSLILNIRNFIQKYKKLPKPTDQLVEYLNSNEYVNIDRLLLYMAGPNEQLKINFSQAFQNYLDGYLKLVVGLFAGFFILSFIILGFCWIPFKNELTNKVWRVKGMLNMIPMNILVNDQNIKEAIQNQNILQAVQ